MFEMSRSSQRVGIDNLHLFLHASDVLIDQLNNEVRFQDAIDEVKKFTTSDTSKYKYIEGYRKFVSSLGIQGSEFYIGKTSKELKCRSLTGTKVLKLFEKIKIGEYYFDLMLMKVKEISYYGQSCSCLISCCASLLIS